jgi:hypothetical protein
MDKWWYHYMLHYDDKLMQKLNKSKTKKMKKETRGRKALPAKEKKQPLYIMVKQKFIKEVQPKLKEIEREYTAK